MKPQWLPGIAVSLLCCASIARCAEPPTAPETFFELKIRPVLAQTCSKCHGEQKAGNKLRLDSHQASLKGGESGAVIVPGKPDDSLLIKAIRHSGDVQMPPDKKLPDEVISDFETWVRQGAVWPVLKTGSTDPFQQQRHWAFRPLEKHAPPPDPQGWAESEVDRFIIDRLRTNKLSPVAIADKRTLLRRACFDLVGLPPTAAQMEKFLNDKSSQAYANLVDELLALPQYGEKWGRHWMDVARYADTAGDNADYPVPELYKYRDYIIDSFNADKPFNQFVREQVAGDILAASGPRDKYAEQVIATGFVALSRRYATAPYELMHLTVEDSIDTVGRAFLGLPLRCARCHDHKFDPVTVKDYYSLYAIFNATKYPFAGSEEFQSLNFPRLSFPPLVPAAEAEPQMDAYRQQIASLEAELKQAETDKKPKEELDRLRTALRVLKRPGLPAALPGAYAVIDGPPVETHIQVRGNPEEPGDKVAPAVLAFLAGDKPIDFPKNSSGRLQLADWLASDENPLTPRVIVNRVWQYHFGRGIVGTASNFGLSGEPPTHPELLDWLTGEFIAGGWSIKKLHRLIMLSKTYRLASDLEPTNAAADPENRYRWRFERRRLDAEAIRDAILLASGQLDLSRPGPHPFPPIEKWGWTQHSPFKEVYRSQHRSVYLMTQRLQRHPYLSLFDGPDTNTTTEIRAESTVPLQALYLMNSPFIEEAATALAARLLAAENNPQARIDCVHMWAYSRPATESEIQRGIAYVADYSRELRHSGVADEAVERDAWASYSRIVLTSNEFFYVD